MAIRTIFSWFMNMPDGRLTRPIGLISIRIAKFCHKLIFCQGGDAIKEVIHDFVTFNLVTTHDKYGYKDEQCESNRYTSASK